MPYARKIVLNSTMGYRDDFKALVADFIRDEVKLIAVVGVNSAYLADVIDELCVGDGSRPYMMLTASLPEMSVDQAVEFIAIMTEDFGDETQVVEF